MNNIDVTNTTKLSYLLAEYETNLNNYNSITRVLPEIKKKIGTLPIEFKDYNNWQSTTPEGLAKEAMCFTDKDLKEAIANPKRRTWKLKTLLFFSWLIKRHEEVKVEEKTFTQQLTLF
jgi:hypothetical protein